MSGGPPVAPKPPLDRHPVRGDFSKVQKSEMSLAKRPRGARGCVLHGGVGHAATRARGYSMGWRRKEMICIKELLFVLSNF